jgi:hypothetical protein
VKLHTVRGRGERERLGRSLGFILARIKIDKAFLFIFFVLVFIWYDEMWVCEKSKSVDGITDPHYASFSNSEDCLFVVKLAPFLWKQTLFIFHFHVFLSVACNLPQTLVYLLPVNVIHDQWTLFYFFLI